MSNDKFVLGAAHAAALEMAMNRPENGLWDNQLLDKLRQGGTLGLVRKFLLGEQPLSLTFDIDRSKPFDVLDFLGDGYEVSYQNPDSLAITKLDLSQIEFINLVREEERCVDFKRHAHRVRKAGRVPLDAAAFEVIWRNRHLLPKVWHEPFHDKPFSSYIIFEGTTFKKGEHEFVLTLDNTSDRVRDEECMDERKGLVKTLVRVDLQAKEGYGITGHRTPVLRPA
jgi:hypothetical protein